jgi:hypothetical protein
MRYNKELLQLLGGIDILSFVRISQLKWIGYVNRMDTKEQLVKYLTIILRQYEEEDEKTDCGIVDRY